MANFSSSMPKVHLNADDPSDPYPLYAVGAIPPKPAGVMRMWVDGCFDLLHFGHANAIRQTYLLGMELQSGGGGVEVLVGCHSDDEILRVKGPSIMKEEERYEALRACKWVTYVVENAPYSTRLKDILRFEADFVVHGDDIALDADGNNAYQEIIDSGRLKVVKRTEGISSTELVGRMLLCTKNHQLRSLEDVQLSNAFRRSNFLTTNRKIMQFSNNSVPQPGQKIVYVDGSFDLLHVGHLHVLKEAKKYGDYLIVGLYEDSTVNKMRGINFPIMNMNERMLGLLSCRYVDEVVLGVPPVVTEELLRSLDISVVVKGTLDLDDKETVEEYYRVPKEKKMLIEVDFVCPLTTDSVIIRVLDNRVAYLQRQAAKKIKDVESEERKPEEFKNVREIA